MNTFFFDNELFLRLAINILISGIIIYLIYFKATAKRSYVFTYTLISVTVFFLCYMLSNVELQLGFALGLFAIFGIIRYRTNTIAIREMTYLFLIITISTINALYSVDKCFIDITIANSCFVLTAWAGERFWMTSSLVRKSIVYDRVDLIAPGKSDDLKSDIYARTGIDIIDYKISNIDFHKGSVKLILFYKEK